MVETRSSPDVTRKYTRRITYVDIFSSFLSLSPLLFFVCPTLSLEMFMASYGIASAFMRESSSPKTRSSLSRITYMLLKYNTQIERYYRSSRNSFLPSFFFPFFFLFSFLLLPLLPFFLFLLLLLFQTTSGCPLTLTIVPTK